MLALWFWTSSFQNYGEKKFCCVKIPSRWHFVIKAWTNSGKHLEHDEWVLYTTCICWMNECLIVITPLVLVITPLSIAFGTFSIQNSAFKVTVCSKYIIYVRSNSWKIWEQPLCSCNRLWLYSEQVWWHVDGSLDISLFLSNSQTISSTVEAVVVCIGYSRIQHKMLFSFFFLFELSWSFEVYLLKA